LLLTLSALVLGGSALILLGREQERLRVALDEAERGQLQAMAERLANTARLAQDELGTALANGAWEDLSALERTNPLVRNVFIFDPEARILRQPDPSAPASTEEDGFLRRYATTVFADRSLWQYAFSAAPPSGESRLPALRRTVYRSRRGEVRAFWLPWTSDNRLHMLGGIQFTPGGEVYGVEIEMVALISRLSLARPENGRYSAKFRSYSDERDLAILALFDGNEQILALAGDLPENSAATPDLLQPVGNALPHWQVGVYYPSGASGTGLSLTHAATGLVLVMVVAILGGGAALFADARRSRREARQRTTFVANVSHELKTPLTSIRLYAELLRDGRVPDDSRRRRFLDTMVQEGERLTRLIDNVLDFGRLEQARRRYHVRPVDLADELRGVLDGERPRLLAAGLELLADLPERLPLETDPDAVRQIVLNLLDNAAKYAADGGRVRVSLAAEVAWVRLEVQDSGPGIPAACRERVFRMFERLDNSLEGKAGSGLGLGIARSLARGLGGDLVCAEPTEPGARFLLTLPLSPSIAPEKTP
jgi:signal transduction histidine kinase